MLATLVGKPFHRAGWVYEEKYDGYRILAYKEGAKVTLLSRNAKDRSRSFPEISRAIGELKPRTLLLDGEAVAVDRNHVTRFQLLQRVASRSSTPRSIASIRTATTCGTHPSASDASAIRSRSVSLKYSPWCCPTEKISSAGKTSVF